MMLVKTPFTTQGASRFMTKLAGFAVVISSVAVLNGCTTFKQSVGDSSLDYTKTQVLAPILLPADTQTQPFVPLYNVPQGGTNTLKLQNEKGKRFELPRPVSTVQ